MLRIHFLAGSLLALLLACGGDGSSGMNQPTQRPTGRVTFEYPFGARGTYSYHYSIHPTMTGTITVTP